MCGFFLFWLIYLTLLIWLLYVPIVLCRRKSAKPKNHTSTLSITYFAQQTHKNKSHVWAADNFPPFDIAFLLTVL